MPLRAPRLGRPASAMPSAASDHASYPSFFSQRRAAGDASKPQPARAAASGASKLVEDDALRKRGASHGGLFSIGCNRT